MEARMETRVETRMETRRTTAFYARQSVDKADSISIESQIEFCKHELRGNAFKEYKDKGFSGKNTDRPDFQRLMKDIEAGLISKVVVYKLDRISRSILDFAGLMQMFGRYNVEFVSSTEKFDTSTPMGRAMLNICIVFAQLERENIQQRVTDAYHSRSVKGYNMGGPAPYGYRSEPHIMDGIRTKKLVIEQSEADFVKLMFEMYADPQTSLSDIARKMLKLGMKTRRGGKISKSTVSEAIRNPIYVMADLDIYNFFKERGTQVVNPPEDFDGLRGCYYYRGRGNKNSKNMFLQGQTLVLAPSEGLIPSELWLKVRKKLMSNATYQPARKAYKSWVLGKIKCGCCGYALYVYKNPNRKGCYFRCTTYTETGNCKTTGYIKSQLIHDKVYDAMCEKVNELKGLTAENKTAKANPKLTSARLKLTQVQDEIEKLLDSLLTAGQTLMSYVNEKIEMLDIQKQQLMLEIADLTLDIIPPNQVSTITDSLEAWDDISTEDKQQVVDLLITRIRATRDSIEIEWKF